MDQPGALWDVDVRTSMVSSWIGTVDTTIMSEVSDSDGLRVGSQKVLSVGEVLGGGDCEVDSWDVVRETGVKGAVNSSPDSSRVDREMVSELHGFCNVHGSCVEGGVGRIGEGVVVLGGSVGFGWELVSVARGVVARGVPLAAGLVLGRTFGVRCVLSSVF
jgi:hypothetical protein